MNKDNWKFLFITEAILGLVWIGMMWAFIAH